MEATTPNITMAMPLFMATTCSRVVVIGPAAFISRMTCRVVAGAVAIALAVSLHFGNTLGGPFVGLNGAVAGTVGRNQGGGWACRRRISPYNLRS